MKKFDICVKYLGVETFGVEMPFEKWQASLRMQWTRYWNCYDKAVEIHNYNYQLLGVVNQHLLH